MIQPSISIGRRRLPGGRPASDELMITADASMVTDSKHAGETG